jgi:K+-transporting ATPase ATPase A chain
MAFIRAFTVKDGGADLGNFYRDLIRFTTRVLMPVAFALALVLIQQGEPQTLAANVAAHTMEGAEQTIALGPVASLETIKHLGTNGGGFFNANAAHPYENPTPITNLVQTLLMIILAAISARRPSATDEDGVPAMKTERARMASRQPTRRRRRA